VVVLPYSMLLMQQARQAVGLSLKESLVIVDEVSVLFFYQLPAGSNSLYYSIGAQSAGSLAFAPFL
jgi:hypothetical protein